MAVWPCLPALLIVLHSSSLLLFICVALVACGTGSGLDDFDAVACRGRHVLCVNEMCVQCSKVESNLESCSIARSDVILCFYCSRRNCKHDDMIGNGNDNQHRVIIIDTSRVVSRW